MTETCPDLAEEFSRRCSAWSDIVEYLPLLHGYARVYQGCRILEVGVRSGNSTVALLYAAQITGGHLWSVDIDDVLARGDGMGPWADHPAWTFTRGHSTGTGTLAKQPVAVDLFFLDSDHGYDITRAEIRAYMPRLAPGGTALFHDTRLPCGDAEAPGGRYPVTAALDEYCGDRKSVV